MAHVTGEWHAEDTEFYKMTADLYLIHNSQCIIHNYEDNPRKSVLSVFHRTAAWLKEKICGHLPNLCPLRAIFLKLC